MLKFPARIVESTDRRDNSCVWNDNSVLRKSGIYLHIITVHKANFTNPCLYKVEIIQNSALITDWLLINFISRICVFSTEHTLMSNLYTWTSESYSYVL